MDDAGVDYTSLLDTEQRRARSTTEENICNVLQKYLLRSGSARSCWTRRCGRAWRWARCTASCSATSTAGTEPRCLRYTPTDQFSVLLDFTFVSMNMEAVIIRVCYIIQKMPGFMTMESLSYGNRSCRVLENAQRETKCSTF